MARRRWRASTPTTAVAFHAAFSMLPLVPDEQVLTSLNRRRVALEQQGRRVRPEKDRRRTARPTPGSRSAALIDMAVTERRLAARGCSRTS